MIVIGGFILELELIREGVGRSKESEGEEKGKIWPTDLHEAILKIPGMNSSGIPHPNILQGFNDTHEVRELSHREVLSLTKEDVLNFIRHFEAT